MDRCLQHKPAKDRRGQPLLPLLALCPLHLPECRRRPCPLLGRCQLSMPSMAWHVSASAPCSACAGRPEPALSGRPGTSPDHPRDPPSPRSSERVRSLLCAQPAPGDLGRH